MKEKKEKKPIKEVTEDKEIKDLLKSKEPVAIFFYAAWCGHCKAMQEPWKNLNEQKKDIKFVKMESENIPSDLGIGGYPHFVFVKDGSVKKTAGGEMSQEQLNTKLFGGTLAGGRRRRNSTRRGRRRVRKVAHRTLRNHMAFA